MFATDEMDVASFTDLAVDRSASEAAYRDLVLRAVAGEKFRPDEIRGVLAMADRDAQQLATDLRQARSRREVVQFLSAPPATTDNRQIDAARTQLEQLIQEQQAAEAE
ncbi:MAG: hypothetical protein L0211_06625, partial [Planctomycetaceae bacterium]|nr:hypothetical protein [Planctomycetaceae bacterium]